MIKVVKKTATLQENKSQLAKLMAAENITVRHMQVRTAKFNLETRVLTCPIWKDMSGVIYDLLMGHEISHALHTPLQGWHDAIVNDKKRKNIKRFLNVIEDARIERIIKIKYPGLRKAFAEAYQELFDRDLFQIKKLNGDYSKMGLIDRINVHFKLGAQALVIFNTEEQAFVDRIATADTWAQVEQLAREVYDYQKAHAQPKPKQQPQPKQPKPKKDKKQNEESDDSEESDESDEGDDANEGDGETEEQDADGNDADPDDEESEDEGDNKSPSDEDGEESDEGDGEESDKDDSEGDASDGDSDEDSYEADDEDESSDSRSNSEPKEGGKSGDDEDDSESEQPVEIEPDSETDKAFRDAEEGMNDRTAESQVFFKMPEAHLENIIVSNKTVLDTFETGIRYQMQKHYGTKLNYDAVAMGVTKVFHTRNKNYIQLLVKEFEMRKNASQYSRQMTAKSGDLDGNRLARYKLTNDLFRKVTTIAKGKSHGMVMFLDMSISMSDFMRYVVEQSLILATFCKRVGIPFDLYGYTDGHGYYGCFGKDGKQSQRAAFTVSKDPDNTFTLQAGDFCLRHLLSSKFSGNHYKRSFNMVNMFGELASPYGRPADVATAFGSVPNFSLAQSLETVGMNLGGTPFIETLVASKEIIKQFKNEHHSDIVNVIYLSDGDGNNSMVFPPAFMNNLTSASITRTKFGVTDATTKISVLPEQAGLSSGNYMFNMFQASVTELIQATTGARHIGYYFGQEAYILQRLAGREEFKKDFNNLAKQLKTTGFVAVPNLGYSNYYYVDTTVINDGSKCFMNAGMTQDQLFQAFSYNQKKKHNNKLIARQFAAEVAE
jgi:hypothetical protein